MFGIWIYFEIFLKIRRFSEKFRNIEYLELFRYSRLDIVLLNILYHTSICSFIIFAYDKFVEVSKEITVKFQLNFIMYKFFIY